MIRILLLLLITSCTLPNSNAKSNNDNISFDENLTFNEFQNKLKVYSNKSSYPNIDE